MVKLNDPLNIIQDDVKPDVANAEEEDMGNESEAASCKRLEKAFYPKPGYCHTRFSRNLIIFLKLIFAAKYKVMGQCNVVFAMKYFINWKIYMNVQFRFKYITGKLKPF